MFDCSKDIRNFHNTRANLPEEIRKKLRGNRSANQKRLKNGLTKNEDPAPVKFAKQGSYAMLTMVQDQHGGNDFDIDDGVVFLREDLKGPQGGAKSALAARQMVCNALQDDTFKTPPEVKTNCVRVHYDEGHHVDIPVYRKEKDAEDTEYELASADWKTSNPEGVTQWFNDQLKNKKSSAEESDSYQMRRLVRLLKFWGRSRQSWTLPSGFIWTVLTDEAFECYDTREDQALYNMMKAIRDRITYNKVVNHPVVEGETLTKTTSDTCMEDCKDKLTEALGNLDILFSHACTRSKALKAWKNVFKSDFFDAEIDKAEDAEKRQAAKRVAKVDNPPRPWSMI
jgi:hypothetical protein